MPQTLPERDQGWFSQETATLGDRLAGAREGLGMSQADLARRLGVKLKTLQNWEDDISEPRANKLQMVSGVLNVSVMWLLNGEGEGPDRPGGSGALPSDISSLLGEVRGIQGEMSALAARLGQLEKRLRGALKDAIE